MWWYNIVYFGWETYGLVQLRCRDQDCQIQSWPPMHTKKNTSGNKKKKTPSRSTLTSLCQTFRNYSDLLSQCTNDMLFWVCFFFEKNRDSELYELDSKLCELWNGKLYSRSPPSLVSFSLPLRLRFHNVRLAKRHSCKPEAKHETRSQHQKLRHTNPRSTNDLKWSNMI